MKKVDSKLNLTLAFDENYLIPFYVVLTSIFTNNIGKTFMLHLIVTGVSDETKSKIILYCTQNGSKVFFYNIDTEYVKNFAVSNDPRYTLAVYYRLFIPHLIPNKIRKIIYLDTDTIVVGDLCQLYNVQMGEVPAAFAVDPIIRPDLGINEVGKYFNSGVILINVKHWLKQKITEKAIAFLRANPEKVVYHDQDALNVVLKGNWFKFSNRFNLTFRDIPTLNKEEYNEFLIDKIVMHYNDAHKPWDLLCCHPFQFLYFDYFLRFITSEVGEYMSSINIEIQFFYLIIEMLESVSFNKSDDADFVKTQLICAYHLHLVILKVVNSINIGSRKNAFVDLIKKHYSRHENNEDLLSLNIVFDDNRNLLLQIFQRIMNPDSSDPLPSWVVRWVYICNKELKTLNGHIFEHTYEARLTKLIDIVNTRLRVSGPSEVILFYLIGRIMEINDKELK